MTDIELIEREKKAVNTLLRKMMQLGIIACLFTLIFEYFFPHGLDYIVTISLLIINTLGLSLSIYGYEKISFHAFILAVLTLFVIMDWGYGHRYYSAFKIFALGVVFVFIVLKNNRLITSYIILFTLLECLSIYSFIFVQQSGDVLLLIYEWIHVVAYNFALSFMCYFFVKYIVSHQRTLQKQDIDKRELEIKLSREQMRGYQNLLVGQEKERQRLSQDIHDGLSIRLGQLKNKLKTTLDGSDYSKEMITSLETIQNDVRNISHALSPNILQYFGLKKAVNDLIFQIEMYDVDIDINFVYSSLLALTNEEEKHLYYIIQELLNNAVKHSSADQINIALSIENKKVCLKFSDNGKGYDSTIVQGKGIGIDNIYARAAVLGGNFAIIHKDGETEHQVIF